MGHEHHHEDVKNIKVAFFLNLFFTLLEIVGGWVFHQQYGYSVGCRTRFRRLSVIGISLVLSKAIQKRER